MDTSHMALFSGLELDAIPFGYYSASFGKQ